MGGTIDHRERRIEKYTRINKGLLVCLLACVEGKGRF